MIKPTELRIGNFILIHDCLQEIVELPLPENCTNENTKGIPLNEEWLESLGFKETDKKDAHVINLGEYELYVACNSFSGTLTKEPSWYCSVAIGYGSQPMSLIKKHVHDLQNLFFALAGTELEIKQSLSACR
jgi:hypothetical protein